MSEIIIKRGTVTAISQRDGVPTGLKLDNVDEWHNYSKQEYRQKNAWYEPKKGDKVELHEQESGNGRVYVKAILPLQNGDVPFADDEGWAESDSEAQEQGSKSQGVSQHTKEIMAEIAVKLAVDCYIAGKIEWAQIMEATEFFTECQVSSAR